MIRIDAAWLATAPLDMRAGTDTALARVIATFGAAHPPTLSALRCCKAARTFALVRGAVICCSTSAVYRAAMKPAKPWGEGGSSYNLASASR